MRSSNTNIVWFRQDLRLADNPALAAALAGGGCVLPVFIWAPDEEGEWPPGGASRWWLHHSLERLAADLADRGAVLVLRAGPSLDMLRNLAHMTGATAIHWNRRIEPLAAARDAHIADQLERDGLRVTVHGGSQLFDPGTILTGAGKPYTVFTPFSKACLARVDFDASLSAAPARLSLPRGDLASLPLDRLGLLDRVDWAAGLRATWQPGEREALRRAEEFARDRVGFYPDERDRPDLDTTSRLSAHLHFGEISPARLWMIAQEASQGARSKQARAVQAFQRQILWREFGQHLLAAFPETPASPLREEFTRFPWNDDAHLLSAWERGQTGYPIVDAGMRQLWQTGGMHNRVRMVVASFLTKDLLVDWVHGAHWFWDTLVDADLANNTLGWQWTSGCGADAAPYFRVFNPVLQGRRFDPEGTYVRRWVPELADLPTTWIHAPWTAPANARREAGVTLGRTYPHPVVDHDEARSRALEAYAQVRDRHKARAT